MRPRGMSLEETFHYYVLGSRPMFEQPWLWAGRVNRRGTAVFTWNDRHRTALRTSYELFIGPVPADALVLNRYGRQIDVNPRNLVLGPGRSGRSAVAEAGQLRRNSVVAKRPAGLTLLQSVEYFLPTDRRPDEPWLWRGPTSSRGIPIVKWRDTNHMVPMLMYRTYIDSQVRPGFIARNKFGNELDVNPAHIELVWSIHVPQ